jgi:hypothetical protein
MVKAASIFRVEVKLEAASASKVFLTTYKTTLTGYGLDGPGIESRWGRDFPHLYRPALGPTQPPKQWVPGLPQGKEWPRCDADPSPPSSAVVMKG